MVPTPVIYLGIRPPDTPLRTLCIISHRMSYRRRQALELLADAGQHGCADSSFLARFTVELLELMDDGLVTAEREITRSRGRLIEGARVRITDAGRAAIEGRLRFTLH